MSKAIKLWIEFEDRPGYRYLCPMNQLIKLLVHSPEGQEEANSGKDMQELALLLRTALKQLQGGK